MGVRAARAALGRVCEAQGATCVLQATPASHGLALGGGSGAGPAVTADSRGVGVERVNSRGTVGQLDGHLLGLVVGTDSMVGFDVGGLQDGLLSPQVENREPLEQSILLHFLATISHYQESTCYSFVFFHLSPPSKKQTPADFVHCRIPSSRESPWHTVGAQ